MKNYLLFFFLMAISSQLLFSQEIRERYFKETDRIYQKAQNANAEILAPNFYEEGLEFYQDAETGLDEGDKLKDIENKLSQATYYFTKAYETAVNSKELLKNTLKARADARNYKADEHAKELWNDAEEVLRDAASYVEDNERADAEETGLEAEKLYRKGELKAIKHLYLTNARKTVSEAKEKDADDYAPETFELSKELISKAEKQLDSSRYDNEKAKRLAKKAEMQANHSIAITEYLMSTDENDFSREEIILNLEKPLISIAEKMGIKADLTNGFTGHSEDLLAEVNNYNQLKQDHKKLQAQLKQNQMKLEQCENENSNLRKRLNAIDEFEEKYNEIETLFTSSEAEVLRIDKKIIIRLISLQFASGSSELRPRYFDLLTRVKTSIEKFDSPDVIVEGHTDAEGEAVANLRLSKQRADAVYRYLTANLNIPKENVSSVGQGESKPVANNQTESGRRKNRRIDIIIQP